MKIRFFDKKTGEDATLSVDGTQFVLSESGEVLEFIEQPHASHVNYTLREDVGFELIMTMMESIGSITIKQ